jgi:rhodanese-related sulfurtransferase
MNSKIKPEDLWAQIGSADSPVVIDVRVAEDVAAIPALVPASVQHGHADIHEWASTLTGRRAAIICHKGLKLSEGVAALLRLKGIEASVVEGGAVAWKSAGLPMVPLVKIPSRVGHVTRWVTRERPKIDRIACPWLIKRFVDPDAEFLFVEASQVLAVSERFDATPFDIEGVFWSHRDETCTFDTMVAEFGLGCPALNSLCEIVRGADTARLDLAPQAAGLLAISLGLSRNFQSDLKQLEAGMTVYDALYAWARGDQGETHNWPAQVQA